MCVINGGKVAEGIGLVGMAGMKMREDGRKKCRTFSMSDLDTSICLAMSRFAPRRLRTAFVRVTLCACVKPPCLRSRTMV